MTCTRAEFMSWLPGATRHAPVRVNDEKLTVSLDGGFVQITLQEKAPREAGAMTLPVLEVTLRFSGLDAASRERFIAYFDLYTRRGGG